MAGYSSDDDGYYSDGGWGEEDNSGYPSDNHSEQQVSGGYDNVHETDEQHVSGGYDNVHETDEGFKGGDYYEEQSDDDGSDDECRGTELEELYDQPGDQVGRYEVPGNVTVYPGQTGPQQTLTRSTGKQSGVDGGQHPVTSYEWSSRTRHQDKKTGDYERATMKHTFASGDTFKERSTGRIGFKDEYKQSTTVTIGNKGGYSEYRLEERLRTIEFGKSGCSGSGSGSSSSG